MIRLHNIFISNFLIKYMQKEPIKELIEKYQIDLGKLKQEQIKLSKSIELKDKLDLSSINRICAIDNLIIKNQIISAVVIVDKNLEVIEEAYFLDKLRFPYISEYKAYRLLPSMNLALSKIKEKPDITLIEGEGINHPRLGIASHFSIASGIPSIGVSDILFEGNKIENGNVLSEKKVTGKVLISKEGSRPLFICPGNNITIESAYNFVKTLIREPHKMPEPMHIARKYAKGIQKELKI